MALFKQKAKMKQLFIFFSIFYQITGKLVPIEPEKAAKELLSNNSDELFLIFTGDTQYYFPCTFENKECKAKSVHCREKNGLTEVRFEIINFLFKNLFSTTID